MVTDTDPLKIDLDELEGWRERLLLRYWTSDTSRYL